MDPLAFELTAMAQQFPTTFETQLQILDHELD